MKVKKGTSVPFFVILLLNNFSQLLPRQSGQPAG